MSNNTFTTGQASIHFGFMVTGKFIESMGLTPAGSVKGNPVWSLGDWDQLRENVAEHVRNLPPISGTPKPGPAAKPPKAPKQDKKAAAAPAAKPYSDDEDEDEL